MSRKPINLCDCCHQAEKTCPIWAPSGCVEKCAEWQPVTRFELAAREARISVLQAAFSLICGRVEAMHAKLCKAAPNG